MGKLSIMWTQQGQENIAVINHMHTNDTTKVEKYIDDDSRGHGFTCCGLGYINLKRSTVRGGECSESQTHSVITVIEGLDDTRLLEEPIVRSEKLKCILMRSRELADKSWAFHWQVPVMFVIPHSNNLVNASCWYWERKISKRERTVCSCHIW